MNKIKVGAVSYLNTKPLLYGMEGNAALLQQMDLYLDYPAQLVALFQQNKLDIALMPVVTLLLEPDARLVSNYGITATSDVASVCIFSRVPILEVDRIILDYQSRTSVLLAQILLKEYWKKEVEVLAANDDFISEIKGNTAAVVIGDRALRMLPDFRYVYDLAAIWKLHTGLPFVFAGWITKKEIPADFLFLFEQAQAVGLNYLEEIAAAHSVDYFDLPSYFKNNLCYHITDEARAGLQLFMSKVEQHYLLDETPIKLY